MIYQLEQMGVGDGKQKVGGTFWCSGRWQTESGWQLLVFWWQNAALDGMNNSDFVRDELIGPSGPAHGTSRRRGMIYQLEQMGVGDGKQKVGGTFWWRDGTSRRRGMIYQLEQMGVGDGKQKVGGTFWWRDGTSRRRGMIYQLEQMGFGDGK